MNYIEKLHNTALQLENNASSIYYKDKLVRTIEQVSDDFAPKVLKHLQQSAGLRFCLINNLIDADLLKIHRTEVYGKASIDLQLKLSNCDNYKLKSRNHTLTFVDCQLADSTIDTINGNTPIYITEVVNIEIAQRIKITLDLIYFQGSEPRELTVTINCSDILLKA